MQHQPPQETYSATVEHVVDGDTCDILVDLGLNILKRERIRLAGIDAPETRSRDLDEKRLGQDAKAYLERALMTTPARRVRIKIVPTGKSPYDKFGRLLAYVYDDDALSINERMLAEGYAFAYDGKSARGAHDLEHLRTTRRAASNEAANSV
jgi:micrococcal nuclease